MPHVARYSLLVLVTCSQIACQRTTPQPPRQTDTESAYKARPSQASNSQNTERIVDLTHSFDKNTVYWPTAEGFKLTIDARGVTEKGYFYSANSFAAAEHGGTHIDAPIHFYQKRQTIDEVPLEQLIGEGVLVDVSSACEDDRDYQITVADLYAWEQQHNRQLVNVIVLLRTGFGKSWPNRAKYLGTNERGPDAIRRLHFPGLHPNAARWLVEHRDIKAIGIDTASIDFGQSTRFASHVTLFKHNVPVIENVANLESLPVKGFQVIALPMKIAGGSGGPARIVGVIRQ